MRSAFSQTWRILVSLVSLVFISSSLFAQPASPSQCVDCHSKVTPNIVSDWKLSKHSGAEVLLELRDLGLVALQEWWRGSRSRTGFTKRFWEGHGLRGALFLDCAFAPGAYAE